MEKKFTNFNFTLGLKHTPKNIKRINKRHAIRAIIVSEDKLLMVQTNKGDYKFPGGGVKNGESHKETIIREVMEETGYFVQEVTEKVGEITEIKLDDYEENTIFKMKSHYYICNVDNVTRTQALDIYELELGFTPKWISLNNIIEENEKCLNSNSGNAWTYRETLVLKNLEKYI